jgi:hypothetical protein
MALKELLLALLLLLHVGCVAWAMFDIWRRRPIGAAAAVAESILIWLPLLGPLVYLWLTRMRRESRPEASVVSSDFGQAVTSSAPHEPATKDALEKRLVDPAARQSMADAPTAESASDGSDSDRIEGKR